MMRLRHFLYIIVLMLSPLVIMGQSLEDAKKLLQDGSFQEAKQVLDEIYTKTPNNSEVNHLLGVIAINNSELQKAEEYLKFASQKRFQTSYLELGELYAKTYRFDDAEKEFDKYEKANRRNKDALQNLEAKRDYANKLERMVGRTEDIQIIDSVVLNKTDFLAAYKLSESSGSIKPLNSFLKDQPDEKMPFFTNERNDKIYYSRKDADRGYKIFTMEKLLGEFGNEKALSENINQSGNQAYPFVLSDGLTIYFASTGSESIGGYDIFVTRYNLATESYLTPNHLNMPFNSPFNDYMMAVDEEKGIGWFASDRFQNKDSVCIYTFIQPQGITLIDSDDEDYLRNRAMISSIAQSQKEGVDYTLLIQEIQKDMPGDSKQKKDFEFIINNDNKYFTLEDFRHGAAKALYSQVLVLESKYKQITDELLQLRSQYASGTTNQVVINTILALEKESEEIYKEIKSLELKARNEEIRNIY